MGAKIDHRSVSEAVYTISRDRLPLRYGKDTIVVSPEAAEYLWLDWKLVSRIDLRLHGLEMRLEMHQ